MRHETLPTIIDVNIEDHGTICILQPLTPFGHDWLITHCPDGVRFSAGAVACEPRYVEAIAAGMVKAGLVVTL